MRQGGGLGAKDRSRFQRSTLEGILRRLNSQSLVMPRCVGGARASRFLTLMAR